jgi:hypothetical protein
VGVGGILVFVPNLSIDGDEFPNGYASENPKVPPAVALNVDVSSNVGSPNGDSGGDDDDEQSKVLDGIVNDSTPGRATKGPTVQRVRNGGGGFNRANQDFNALRPSNVRDIQTRYGAGRTGTLRDGRTVTVRPGSTDGRATLEVRKPSGRGIEIRFDP